MYASQLNKFFLKLMQVMFVKVSGVETGVSLEVARIAVFFFTDLRVLQC